MSVLIINTECKIQKYKLPLWYLDANVSLNYDTV